VLDLRAHLARRAGESPADAERAAAIEALARCGLAADLDLMVRFAAGDGEPEEEAPLSRALERGTERLLERDETAYGRIGSALARAPAGLRGVLLAAVDARQTEAGLHVLARVAEENADVAPVALARLARSGARARKPIDEGIRRVVRSILAEPSSGVLAEAALAAGSLDDDESIPRLLDLLGDARPGVRANAEWSLERLSGLELLGGADRWRAWYRAEQTWSRAVLPGLEKDLASGDRERIAAALDEIAGKRWQRHELAQRVARVLHDPDPGLAALACDALRHLRSSAVREDLEACRGHASPAVREAAERALAAIAEDGRPGRAGSRRGSPRDLTSRNPAGRPIQDCPSRFPGGDGPPCPRSADGSN
jgi:hypothetical protein